MWCYAMFTTTQKKTKLSEIFLNENTVAYGSVHCRVYIRFIYDTWCICSVSVCDPLFSSILVGLSPVCTLSFVTFVPINIKKSRTHCCHITWHIAFFETLNTAHIYGISYSRIKYIHKHTYSSVWLRIKLKKYTANSSIVHVALFSYWEREGKKWRGWNKNGYIA